MRLFLAAELDRAAKEQCEGLIATVRRSLGDAGDALRWNPAANIHITLHFLGDVDRAGTDRLMTALGESIPQPRFDAHTTSLGAFPVGGPPRIVWLGIGSGASELTAVHATLSERLRRARFEPEARSFSPHLTLARVRDHDRGKVRGLRVQLAALPSPPIAWCVDHVTLFQSDLSGTTPRYVPVGTLPLA